MTCWRGRGLHGDESTTATVMPLPCMKTNCNILNQVPNEVITIAVVMECHLAQSSVKLEKVIEP